MQVCVSNITVKIQNSSITPGISHVALSFFLIWPCWVFRCSIWDLAPWPVIEPRPPVLGVQSLSHWVTRVVPHVALFFQIYLFMAALGLHCCTLAFSSCGEQGLPSSCGMRASHFWGPRVQGLSVSIACGIFPDQDRNQVPFIGR